MSKLDESLDRVVSTAMLAMAYRVKELKDTPAYERDRKALNPFQLGMLDLQLQIKARDWFIARLLTQMLQGGQSLAFEDEYVGGKTYAKDVCVMHDGGLWRSRRETYDEPGQGDAWHPI